jgi:peptidoglycan/xylan/chitin deacetylase (PgdA/CDA1 family)
MIMMKPLPNPSPEPTAAPTEPPIEHTEPTPEPFIRPDLDPDAPMIALTFDDGPNAHTLTIIELLRKYNSRATFFVLGLEIPGKEDIIQLAADYGNEVAGHSWSHGYLSSMTDAQIERELIRTYEAIEDIVGQGQTPMFFRAPYGSALNNVMRVSRNLGFSIIGWSIDPRDWEVRNTDIIHSRTLEHAFDGGIVILHDIYDVTVEAVERIIPDLIELGYQLVTVSELLQYKGIEPEPGQIIRRAE